VVQCSRYRTIRYTEIIFDEEVSDRAFVNWEAVEAFLEAGGYLPELEDNQG
jgi:hypothetical protein